MKKQKIYIIGIALLILFAGINIAKTIVTNSSAEQARPLHVVFCGEYKIGDGQWMPVVDGKHIEASKGEVVLKGTLYKAFPDGEIIEPVLKDEAVAMYFDHIGGDVYINGNKTYTFDTENPQYGNSTCVEQWTVYLYEGMEEDSFEIHFNNPHRFGNEMAIDNFLKSMRMYGGADFEYLMQGELPNTTTIGAVVVFIALLIFGAAIFSSLTHLENSKVMWLMGAAVSLVGCYFVVSNTKADVFALNQGINTVVSVICVFLYVFFMQVLVVQYFVEKTKVVGTYLTAVSGISTGALLLYTLAADAKIYDMLGIWAGIQLVISFAFLACYVDNLRFCEKKMQKLHIAFSMTFIAVILDIIGIWQGWWQVILCSTYVFMLLLVIAIIVMLRIFPRSIVAMIKEEKLQAELERSKTALLLSQIKPHFLYNSLSAIRELCRQDPEDARTAIGIFIDYLRGNMESLQKDHNVHFSKELKHIYTYLELEKMRFGDDLNIVLDIQETEFYIPPLIVQPLVENAVKHGICSREDGGTLTFRTYRENDQVVIQIKDDGMGFDPNKKLEKGHVGLNNVRNRLQSLVGGELDIKSILGEGTIVTIKINDRKD